MQAPGTTFSNFGDVVRPEKGNEECRSSTLTRVPQGANIYPAKFRLDGNAWKRSETEQTNERSSKQSVGRRDSSVVVVGTFCGFKAVQHRCTLVIICRVAAHPHVTSRVQRRRLQDLVHLVLKHTITMMKKEKTSGKKVNCCTHFFANTLYILRQELIESKQSTNKRKYRNVFCYALVVILVRTAVYKNGER